jgi:hypothetical protein
MIYIYKYTTYIYIHIICKNSEKNKNRITVKQDADDEVGASGVLVDQVELCWIQLVVDSVL